MTSNTVSPGPTRTPGMEAGARQMVEAQGGTCDFASFETHHVKEVRLPAGHMGSPADIADAAAFLASPRAAFITGANLRVDGGMMPAIN